MVFPSLDACSTNWAKEHFSILHKISPAHRFPEECRWGMPKWAVSLVSRVKLAISLQNCRCLYKCLRDISLWSELLFFEDTNTVSTVLHESALCVQLPAQYRCIHVCLWDVQISYYVQISGNKPRWCSFIYQRAPHTVMPRLSPVNVYICAG